MAGARRSAANSLISARVPSRTHWRADASIEGRSPGGAMVARSIRSTAVASAGNSSPHCWTNVLSPLRGVPAERRACLPR
ncbi:hypothetical protein ACFQH8_18425 [Halomicroarcula sp. GCM10025710]